MEILKNFKQYETEHINESKNIGIDKFQTTFKKILNKTKLNFHSVSLYESSIILLALSVNNYITSEKFIMNPNTYNILLLTLYGVTILTNENKEKISKLYDFLKEKEIDDDDIKNIVNILRNIYNIFKIIMKDSDKSINKFEDMLTYPNIMLPFLKTLDSFIKQDRLDSTNFYLTFDKLKEKIEPNSFDILIDRILHKLNIITSSTNKFQNKDNIKPLIVNDEFKSPELRPKNAIIEGENIEYYLFDNELNESNDDDEPYEGVHRKVTYSKKLSKEMKEKILPLIISAGIHGTKYIKGRVLRLRIPHIKGKTFKGVDLGADENGFFVFTHRARSKSYPSIAKIPNKAINFIETTG